MTLFDVAVAKKLAGGAGGGLPEVTSADNGDILAVVNGEWAATEKIVFLSYTEEDGLSKTWQEIYDLAASGAIIIAGSVGENDYLMELVYQVTYDDEYANAPYICCTRDFLSAVNAIYGAATANEHPRFIEQ